MSAFVSPYIGFSARGGFGSDLTPEQRAAMRMEAAQRRLMEIDSRLTLLYQTLRRNEYVLESELRNGEDPGRGWAANIGRHDA